MEKKISRIWLCILMPISLSLSCSLQNAEEKTHSNLLSNDVEKNSGECLAVKPIDTQRWIAMDKNLVSQQSAMQKILAEKNLTRLSSDKARGVEGTDATYCTKIDPAFFKGNPSTIVCPDTEPSALDKATSTLKFLKDTVYKATINGESYWMVFPSANDYFFAYDARFAADADGHVSVLNLKSIPAENKQPARNLLICGCSPFQSRFNPLNRIAEQDKIYVFNFPVKSISSLIISFQLNPYPETRLTYALGDCQY